MADRGRGDGGGRGRGGQQHGSKYRGRGGSGDRGRFHATSPRRGDFTEDRGRGGRGRGGRGRGGFVQDKPKHGIFMQNDQINPMSQTIRKIEDDTFEDSLTSTVQNLRLDSTSQLRTAYGTKGVSTELWTNYFELIPDKGQKFFRYAVSVLSEGKGDEPKAVATDYQSILIGSRSLGFSSKEFAVTYSSEAEKGPSQKAPKYKVKIQRTGVVTFAELLEYLSSTTLTQNKPAVKDQIIQATNIIIAHGMKSNSDILTKKNKYFPGRGALFEQWMLRNGLEAFRGFFMSVRAATGRILLNVQVQHIAVWQTLPLTRLLDKMRTDGMSDADISRAISGLWVHVSHLQKRLKRIAGLATGAEGRRNAHPPQIQGLGANANQVRFWKDTLPTPGYVSVAQHFKQAYNITLATPNYPLVNVGTRDMPVFLPAEVCDVRKLQDYQKKLSRDATAEMIKFAVRPAPQNAATIASNGLELLKQNAKPMLDAFRIQVNPQMLTVQGRVLPSFIPQYSSKPSEVWDAGWNMKNVQFSKKASLPAWTYFWITAGNRRGAFDGLDDVRECVAAFSAIMGRCGIRDTLPRDGRQVDIKNVDDPDAEIDTALATLTGVNMVLFLLPFQSIPIYNAIKRAGDIKFGVHTVTCVAGDRKFAKKPYVTNHQYFANVALKFNLKAGGHNQLLQSADLGFVSEGKTMLVGLDVTHPAPGSSDGAPSVSSITASIDRYLSQWPADVKIQTGRKEMIQGLKDMFKSRLVLWRKHNNNKLPEEVIIYRDGVGETMYQLVIQEELPQIRAACAEIYTAAETKANKPCISIIICGKRHHTRFYPTKEKEADPRTGGTKSGTVVDRGITETRVWDFYLQAHQALQGTPKSAHYVVVLDEIFGRRANAIKSNDERKPGQRAADDLEGLTHAMCYMFGRATKAVSLCPPAYYADLVCDRARRWLSRVFDERTVASSRTGSEVNVADVTVHSNLKDTMFYI